MSETSYFLSSQPPSDQPQPKPDWRDGESLTPDGPPVWLCTHCKKQMEGTWNNGLKTKPKCPDHGDHCFVQFAVAWMPKTVRIALQKGHTWRDKKFFCSEECFKLYDTKGEMDLFPQ